MNPNQAGPRSQASMLVPKVPETATPNQNIMYMLADGTGGFMIVNTNDMLGGMEKVAKELNEYYVLGYTPPESPEGSCHELKVKVDRNGTTVRSRTGYCNTKPQDLLKESPVEKTLEARLATAQAGTIGASMRLPYFYTSLNVARVNVAAEMKPDGLKFEKVKGKFHTQINILGIAYKTDGTVAARFSDAVKFDFDDKKEADAFEKNPVHYENQFEIASGTYNMKLVFGEGDKFGKIEMPLVIDPYDPKEFALSALALSKQARKASDLGTGLDTALLEDKIPLIFDGIQITPTGSTVFDKSGTAVFYAEVYEPLLVGDGTHPSAIAIQMRVLDRKTGEQKVDTGPMRVDIGQDNGTPVIPLGQKMPVQSLNAGQYRLELKVFDEAGKQVQRTSDFDIE